MEGLGSLVPRGIGGVVAGGPFCISLGECDIKEADVKEREPWAELEDIGSLEVEGKPGISKLLPARTGLPELPELLKSRRSPFWTTLAPSVADLVREPSLWWREKECLGDL